MEHNHNGEKTGIICKKCKEEVIAVKYGWGWACNCPGTKDLSEYEELSKT